ncbi:voltage-dependent chloride channel 2, chloroplastic-like [Raphanus sativus]|uniref:Voltage-dependent chloride channel 2, chloroplastic-like n=1 Tax=Raphanus sativus TaxID=3726 RepID=A0A6J0N330_RAPSA|nr:voltage-dependent chloride channel 2, chloroplastic-like [Raphanus sativus]
MYQSMNLSFSSNLTHRSLLLERRRLRPGISARPRNFKPSCVSSDPDSSSEDSSPINLSTKLVSLLKAVPDWSDGIKERRMQQKRSLYTHENWVRHRSSLRHLRHVSSSASSRVILSLIPPVFFFTTVAVLIAGYNSAVGSDLLPSFFPVLRASSLPYQLTAPALALLLVFRTEASYSRFEQGRKAWVKIITGTNDLARQVVSSVNGGSSGDDDELIIRDALLRYIAAFPVALKCHVIYGSDIADDLRNVVEDDDLSLILQSKHRPRCVIQFISQSLQLLNLDSTKIDALESKMLQLQEGIGVCDQLMGIPIPLSYTRLTSRLLVLWHLTLPVILWDDCHWNVVPATFISAASLFCIEEVGVLIEEPFSMLALDELCDMVLSNIDEAVKSEKVIRNRIIAKKRMREIKHSSNGWHKS